MESKAIGDAFAETLRTRGLWDAVAFLNATTEYRFTGIYRFVGGTLRNVVLVDRENPGIRAAPDVDASLSYCSLMRESGQPVQLEDATDDPRTLDHPSRDTVQAYCGIPLIDDQGQVIGSLCHFAEVPTLVFDEDLEVLLLLPRILDAAGFRLERAFDTSDTSDAGTVPRVAQ